MSKSILCLSLLSLSALLLPSRAYPSDEGDEGIGAYTAEHPLVYEDVWDLPPYSFRDSGGESAGFNIDLVREILARLDIPYVIRQKDIADTYQDLQNGKSDLMLGMYTSYHDRFGEYGPSTVALLTHGIAHPKSSSPGINTTEDLRSHRVAVQRNSISHVIMQSRGMENSVEPYDDIEDAIRHVADSDSGEVLWNTMSLKYMLSAHKYDNLTVTPIHFPNGEYRFMSNDEELLAAVDSVFLAMEYNEELQPIRNKWFYPEIRPSGIPSYVIIIFFALLVLAVLLVASIIIYRVKMKNVSVMNKRLTQRMEFYLLAGNIRMWIYDVRRAVFVTFSQHAETREEYSMQGFSAFFNDDDYKALCRLIDDMRRGAARDGELIVRCHSIRRPDLDFYFGTRLSVFAEKDGAPLLILGAMQDIHDARRRRIQTQEMLLRYDTMFNMVDVDMAFFNSDGVLTDINDSICKTFKVKDKASLLGKGITVNDIPTYEDADIAHFEERHSTIIIGDSDAARKGNGKYPGMPAGVKYYNHMILPLYTGDGSLMGILSLGHDITWIVRNYQAEKKREKHILSETKKQNEYIRNINYALQTSKVWLICYYPSTRTLEITHSLDKPPIRLSQLRCVMLTDETDRRRLAHLLRRMDAGLQRRFYIKVKTVFRAAGRDTVLQLDGIPVFDKRGKTDHYFGLCRDASVLEETGRLLEEEMRRAREAEEVKTAFMRNISYDIRTPLNSVVGFAQMFDFEHSDEDEKIFIDEIRKNSTVLLKLINDILYLSRLDADMVEVNASPTDFACMFASHCMTGWNQELHSGVKTVVEEPYETLVVTIDGGLVGKVLEMLSLCSAHFTFAGVLRGKYEYHHNNLEICIEDTGVGINKKNLELMFDEKNNIENSDQSAVRLKLQICKKIVEKMGGHLDIESEIGKGTSVWVRIPCAAETIKKKEIHI